MQKLIVFIYERRAKKSLCDKIAFVAGLLCLSRGGVTVLDAIVKFITGH